MNRTPSYLRIVLPALFVVVLLLPIMNGVVGIWDFERKAENRTFADSIPIDIQKLDRFPKDAEAYMKDNFSFRTPLLDLYHRLKYYVFSISPHPRKSLMGKDGWVFSGAREKEIYEGKHNFNQEELELFHREWTKRISYLEKKGIKCHWVIAPIKHYVYPEFLPNQVHHRNSTRRVDQVKRALEDDFPDLIIDPLQALIESKKEHPPYFQLDNHWNHRAGYLVSKLLLSKIQLDFPEIDLGDMTDPVWKDSTVLSGFHRKTIGVEEVTETSKFPIVDEPPFQKPVKYNFPIPERFPYPWEYERNFENPNAKSGLRMLVIRDSFTAYLLHFLPQSFSESVFIFDAWQYKLDKEVVEASDPDLVVFIVLETHIDEMIADQLPSGPPR